MGATDDGEPSDSSKLDVASTTAPSGSDPLHPILRDLARPPELASTRAREIEFRGTARFSIRQRLGAGGMGVVYEAYDHVRETTVALKTILHVDAQALYRFKNEFRSLADLNHPNLVRLDELFCEDDRWFFTMELVEGEDFLTHVRSRTADVSVSADTLVDAPDDTIRDAPPLGGHALQFDEGRLRAALAQLAIGIATLHAANRIHRDIKPSNVLVTPDSRVVLLDFGLVTLVGGESSETNLVGTAAYMAPEQAASKPIGQAADWYAMGCVLYEALTGRLPFVGAPIEVLMDKQRFDPPPPRQLVPDVPPDLDALAADLLRCDPSARPSGTQVLYRLGVGDTSIPESFSQTPPFVGRVKELGALREAFNQARAGQSVTFFLHGESGIGKTALVRQFIEGVESEKPRPLALSGRCYERESVPYKAFDGIVDALSRYMSRIDQVQAALLLPDDAFLLGRVFPVLRRVPAMLQLPLPAREMPSVQEVRTRAFFALRRLFARLAERQPVILFIDDLQWADADSLVLLADLLHPPEPPPLLLVATVRTSDAAGIPAILEVPGTVRSVTVESLSPAEARVLVQKLDPLQSVADAAIAEESRGHPLFLQELVRYVTANGGRSPHDIRLDEALWARIARLERPARRLLEILTVAGAPISHKIAAQAVALDGAECSKLLSLLRAAFLSRAGSGESDSFEPYHDRVREALLARMDEPTRRQHHRALATALEAADAGSHDPRLLVRHLEGAGETQRAAQEAERAAEIATRALAFDHSAELYATALRLGRYDESETRRIRIVLGNALANAGRGPESAQALMAAAEGGDAATRLECHKKAAEQLLVSGHIEQGLEALAAILAEVDIALPRSARAALGSLLWRKAFLRLRGLRFREREAATVLPLDRVRLDVYRTVGQSLSMVDPLRGTEINLRGLLLALTVGDWWHVGRCLLLEATHLSYGGRAARARGHRIAALVRDIAERHGDEYLLAYCTLHKALHIYFEGRYLEAVRLFSNAESAFRERTIGTAFELDSTRIFRLWALRNMGALAELRRVSGACILDATQRGNRYVETMVRRTCALLRLADDLPGEARLDLERAKWAPPQRGYHTQHYYELRVHLEADLYEGIAARALVQHQKEFDDFRRSRLPRVIFLRADWHWLLGRLHLVAERPLLRQARALARNLEAERVPYATVWGGLVRAAVAHREGADETCAAVLRRTIATADENAMVLCAAAARRRLGALLGGDEGRALCAQADAWMTAEGIKQPARMIELIAPGFA